MEKITFMHVEMSYKEVLGKNNEVAYFQLCSIIIEVYILQLYCIKNRYIWKQFGVEYYYSEEFDNIFDL